MELGRGFKLTDAGIIPKEWEARGLLSTVSIANGQVDPKTEPFRSMILVAPDHIESGTGKLLEKRTAADQRAISGKYLFDVGDIVYSKIRPYLRKAILADFAGLSSADMYPLRPAPDVVGRFVLSVLLAHRFTKYAESVSVRSGMPKINRTELADYVVALPPIPEQRAIASALSDVDALLDGLERLIAKKRDLKQAAVQQLLTGNTRLPGFGEEWRDCQVRDVISCFFCGPSPTCEERNIQDDEWGVLKTTAVTKANGWDWRKHKTLPRVFWNKPDLEVRAGDVIVTKAGPRHRVGVAAWVEFVPPRIIVSGKMIGLRPRPEKVTPLILAASVSARDAQIFIDQRTTGMAESQVNFENATLLETPIRIPSIDEQTAITSVLSDISAELSSLEARIEKTRALKQGMMQELLTGRTRLLPAGGVDD